MSFSLFSAPAPATDWTTVSIFIITSVASIIVFMIKLDRDHKKDVERQEKYRREDMARMDEEWKILLSKFHDHDKDLHMLKSRNRK